ncbi:flagellin [Thiomicrospira sp. WB1]|uniref:flagellin N-terminal helical domain-containing protein n=1 Tax=Thiomicrospira sp. WB1 TaxID=1685380 RepID=UPI00074AEAEB|nr:flagellin [Thiomicrospira sp. WB1]KUJ71045.1 flagellin [Thiomicrospira sp. WB1]KUJ71627.1 flagellin [Thiomicrospira sp. WB1]
MAMVINTNMAALNANRILDKTSVEQSTAMERLTSGQRINSAADDAAGLAVATGMTSQIRGTEQAIRNANDGMAMIQTVDGATEEVVGMMQRMRELAVQSMNGTYNAENRTQMDEEFTQLQNEIDRIAKTTKFNETSLMNGSNAAISLHVGWETGADNKITVSLEGFSLGSLNTSTAVAIDDAGSASNAITQIDADLSNINTFRAKWGALQNRLESTVSNLANVNENMNSARSQIQDADFARESANLARTQVLQQAGMSMLSQANQQSQNVLSLLR